MPELWRVHVLCFCLSSASAQHAASRLSSRTYTLAGVLHIINSLLTMNCFHRTGYTTTFFIFKIFFLDPYPSVTVSFLIFLLWYRFTDVSSSRCRHAQGLDCSTLLCLSSSPGYHTQFLFYAGKFIHPAQTFSMKDRYPSPIISHCLLNISTWICTNLYPKAACWFSLPNPQVCSSCICLG